MSNLSIGGYDQIMAYTQPKNLQGPIGRLGDHETSLENFTLGAPSVVIRYDANTPNFVILVIHITSGQCKFYPNEDSAQITKTVDNWKLAYTANIGLAKLFEEEARQIREKLDVPDKYSISGLVVDLASIAPGQLESTFSRVSDEIPKASFETIMDHLIRPGGGTDRKPKPGLLDEQLRTLGYVAQASGDFNGSHKATFEPTHLQFQTYPWCGSQGQGAGEGVKGNSILNCLLYTEMTDEHKPPSLWQLPWSANFTDGDASANDDTKIPLGTFVMSKDNFWNRFLVPKLATLNCNAHFKVWGQNAGAWSDGSYNMGSNAQLAANADQEKDVNWCNVEVPNNLQILFPGLSKMAWTFQKNYEQPVDAAKGGLTVSVKRQDQAFNFSAISFYPGTNRGHMKGWSIVNKYCERWKGDCDLLSHSDADRANRTLSWWFDIELRSVNDGGLEVVLTNAGTDYVHDKDQQDLSYTDAKWWDDNVPHLIAQLKEARIHVSEELGDLHKLYYPAGGVLFYTDPVFSANGDVCTTVRFKDSAIGFRNPDAEARENHTALPDPAVQSEDGGKNDGLYKGS
ncbi:hypothetical protein B0A49_06256 [Cryomyces minteri]|uniref:Uncharacterized protein n=1 Tax=Cryomyces minteri TaxID=331657 RepID=A0A4U0X2M0_9PEZI|nr:hypothetical protein B0A49_06256 [Cryomyces minteri]